MKSNIKQFGFESIKDLLIQYSEFPLICNNSKILNIKNSSKATILKNIQTKNNNIENYNLNPTKCLQCNKHMPYEQRHCKFCNHSCAASYNKLNREIPTEQRNLKISSSLKEFYNNLSKEEFKIYLNNKQKFCRIYYCKICGKCMHSTNNKTCSKECLDISNKINANKRRNLQLSDYDQYRNKCLTFQILMDLN